MVVNDLFYQRIATLVIAGVLLYLLYLLLPVLMPFIVAMVLAYLFNPVAKWLGKYGIPRWLGILMVFTLVGTVIVTAMALLIPTLIEQFELGKQNMPKFFDWLNNDARPWIASTFKINLSAFDFDAVSASVMEYFQKNYDVTDAGSVISKIATSGASAAGTIGLFVLVPVVAFFYMLSWENMVNTFKSAIPLRYRAKALSLMKECDNVMMSFVKGQMLVMLLLGTFYALCLEYIVGLETGLFIGFMAGLASIVPYLGFIIGIVSAIIACIVQFGFDITMLVAVIAVFGAGQLLEGYGLQPFLLGDRIGLSPVMVILAVLVGGQLLGLVGMLIGLPLAAVLMVLFRHAMAAYKRSDLYRKRSDGTVIDEASLNDEITAKLAEPIAQPVVPTDFAWVAVADTLPKPTQPKHKSQKSGNNNRRRSNNQNRNNNNRRRPNNQNNNQNNRNTNKNNQGGNQRTQENGSRSQNNSGSGNNQQPKSNNRQRNRNRRPRSSDNNAQQAQSSNGQPKNPQ